MGISTAYERTSETLIFTPIITMKDRYLASLRSSRLPLTLLLFLKVVGWGPAEELEKKGLTFQPFSKDEVEDALSHVIPGASSWMVELEKQKAEEKGAEDSDSPSTP